MHGASLLAPKSVYSSSTTSEYGKVFVCEAMSVGFLTKPHLFNLLLCRLIPDSKNTLQHPKPRLTKNQQGQSSVNGRSLEKQLNSTQLNSIALNGL